ncbi:MAG: TetR/AcrR family transcriptional regulator, partial [Phaeodactylibacter sp.]|nr:TetR/AcrR family transcriptional regulator [Phaeodactylibacter sp.]
GIDEGSFKSINPTVVLFTILTSIRWLHYWTPQTGTSSREILKKEITTLLLHGIQQ